MGNPCDEKKGGKGMKNEDRPSSQRKRSRESLEWQFGHIALTAFFASFVCLKVGLQQNRDIRTGCPEGGHRAISRVVSSRLRVTNTLRCRAVERLDHEGVNRRSLGSGSTVQRSGGGDVDDEHELVRRVQNEIGARSEEKRADVLQTMKESIAFSLKHRDR
jgi:hypothetical protein